MSNKHEVVTMSLGFSTQPSVAPVTVTVSKPNTVVQYDLDTESLKQGYCFAGYLVNTPGAGHELSGSPANQGASYLITDACTVKGNIAVTLFVRNNNNPAVLLSFDPEIINVPG